MKQLLIGLIFLAFTSLESLAQVKADGFADFNYYRDTRGFNNFTLNLGAQLPSNFEYFSFINLNPGTSDTELSSYYSEQHLRWAPKPNQAWDITQLWTSSSGAANDHLQYGLRWKLDQSKALQSIFSKLQGFFFVNFHFVQIRSLSMASLGPQIEYVYKFNIAPNLFNKRLYIMGFADQIFDWTKSGNNNWVTEHQLGFKIKGGLFAVAELRYNSFLPKVDRSGIGLGVEYLILF